MRSTTLFGAVLAVLGLAAALSPTPAAAQEEAEILAVLEKLFDGMRTADTTMMRETLHDDVMLWSAGEREGEPALRKVPIGRWLEAVARPHEEPYDERLWGQEVRIDGRLASVWTNYAFFIGSRLSHCGVDAFQLFRSVEGWKIFHVADTRHTEECDLPAEVAGR